MAPRTGSAETTPTPAATWARVGRHFWLRVGIGLAVLFIIAALYDESVSRALMGWPAHEKWFFEVLTRLGEADWILYPALVVAAGGYLIRGLHLSTAARWTAISATSVGWYIFIGVGAPSIVATVLKRLIGRARPIHLDEMGTLSFHPIQFDWSLAGFPSGHATTAFALAVTLSALLGVRWRWFLFAFATLIAVSRVVTGMHFMTDVIAGAALGTFGAILVRTWFSDRRFPIEIRNNQIRNRAFPAIIRFWKQSRTR